MIRLHDSASRRKVALAPLDPKNVRMYVCGPTVYDRAHLGNARPAVVFDTLFRLLRHRYGADHVTYVRNLTDVDDKINDAAFRRQAAGDPRPLEVLIRERTEETIAWYQADMAALGTLPPTHEPRATEWIAGMVTMIKELLERGHAYEAEGHVLFRVRSDDGYGRLSGRSADDMRVGARVEVAPYKEDALDFVLWKPSDASLPGWESPWGRGRPGWHIECSAMARGLLGESFDIHGGGLDLQFPHHENELAQTRSAQGPARCAQGHDHGHGHDHGLHDGAGPCIWLHNEMLQVEGRKMSKSLGNFFTVRDLLDLGISGDAIRLVFLGTHYRKPMDWTQGRRLEAEAALRRWREVAGAAAEGADPAPEVLAALEDDLNTPQAIAALHALAEAGRGAELRASMDFLGLNGAAPRPAALPDGLLEALGLRLAAARGLAQASRDFTALDRLKAAVAAAGVEVRMSRDGIALHPGDRPDAVALEDLAARLEAAEDAPGP